MFLWDYPSCHGYVVSLVEGTDRVGTARCGIKIPSPEELVGPHGFEPWTNGLWWDCQESNLNQTIMSRPLDLPATVPI